MKRDGWRIFPVLLILLSAALAGCAWKREEPKEPEGYQIYYINKAETAVVREAYTPQGETADELLNEFLLQLQIGRAHV